MDDLRPNMSSSIGADNCPECTEAEGGSQGGPGRVSISLSPYLAVITLAAAGLAGRLEGGPRRRV